MILNNKKYEILIFLIISVQIFYQFPIAISLVKILIVLISLLILYNKLYLKAEKKFFLFNLYLLTIVWSSIINIGYYDYSIKDFLVGFSILLIPIGLYFHITHRNKEQSLRLSFNIQKVIAITSFIVLIYVFLTGTYVDYGALGMRLSGEAITPSMIALNANLVLIFCLLNFIESKKKKLIFPIVFSLIMILLSLSKSGIIIAFLCFIYIAFIKRKYILMTVIVSFLVALIVIALPYNNTIIDLYIQYAESGSMNTLSGRDAIWDTCQNLIKENPFWGYGYNSAIVILPIFEKQLHVEQAHNAFYESMLNIGSIGTLFIGLYILKVIIKCIINFSIIRNNSIFACFFFIIIMGLIRGYTEASFAQANNIIEIFIFYISLFLLDYYVNKKNTSRLKH